MTIRVAFLLPHLRAGGAERCVVNWVGALDRTRFTPLLLLGKVEGAFLDLLPADVVPIALDGARALFRPQAIAAALAEYDVHVAYSATNAMNLALLAAPTRVRRIVSEHTLPNAYLAEAKWPALRRAAMRRYYPRADAVAVPTDRIGAELRETLGRPLALATIPNPVIVDTGAAPAPSGLPGAVLDQVALFEAPPLQERQVNRAPRGSGQAGSLTDLTLDWGRACPQAMVSVRLTRPTPIPVPGETAPGSFRSIRGIDRPGTPAGEARAKLITPTSKTLRILSAGRLVSAKGFDTLIDACALLAGGGVDFRATICGEGPLHDVLAARIVQAGLSDRVTLRGYADLAGELRETDLFVLASRREGFGNVLVEAMAAGVPVLATISGGPETFITDGGTGFLVPPGNPAALAERIVSLLDRGVLERVVEPARTVARGYGVAASTRRLEALIARLAQARSTAA